MCHLQPAPESTQYLPFVIAEVAILVFFSWKIAAMIFFVSYCFAKNQWLCPQCKREVVVNVDVPGSNENLVFRFGNCMIMLTRTKFRIVAAVVVAVLLYFFIAGIKNSPKGVHIEKTWINLANNCGY